MLSVESMRTSFPAPAVADLVSRLKASPFIADFLKPIVLEKVTFSVAKFVAPENFRSEV
jgi:hypothetical protein